MFSSLPGNPLLKPLFFFFTQQPSSPAILLVFVFLTTTATRIVDKYLDRAVWQKIHFAFSSGEKTHLQDRVFIENSSVLVKFLQVEGFCMLARNMYKSLRKIPFRFLPLSPTGWLARSASCLLFLLGKLPSDKSPTEATNLPRHSKTIPNLTGQIRNPKSQILPGKLPSDKSVKEATNLPRH